MRRRKKKGREAALSRLGNSVALPVVFHTGAVGAGVALEPVGGTKGRVVVADPDVVLLVRQVLAPEREFPVAVVEAQGGLGVDQAVVGNGVPLPLLGKGSLQSGAFPGAGRGVLEPGLIDPVIIPVQIQL